MYVQIQIIKHMLLLKNDSVYLQIINLHQLIQSIIINNILQLVQIMGCIQSQLNQTQPKKLFKKNNIRIKPQYNLKDIQKIQVEANIKSDKEIQDNTKDDFVSKTDILIMKQLSLIQKDLFTSNTYLWIDSNINDPQNQNVLLLLKKQEFDIILCQKVEECNQIIINSKTNSRFRIITSAASSESVCSTFRKNQQVVHIYIFGGQKSIGQSLKKREKKVKFCSVNGQQFIKNIKTQSRYDNKFIDLPNFLKITNKQNTHDNTIINKSRYNLHGLLLFKNRSQAKEDFISFAKYFHSIEDKAFNYQIKMFEDEYPIQRNHKLALNWYTRPTFFYGFLNNILRTTSNPLETTYLRHAFESTFKAIKYLYDNSKKRSFMVYRGGYINNQQLKYLEQNVEEYIQMYGFISTSEDIEVAQSFRQRYNGNSLITILIQDQQRQIEIDYGYASMVEFSDLPSQKQVLFNSLNVFKIVQYRKQDGINKVTLKYGQLARMVKLGIDKMQQKQKNIIYNYKHQQQIISKYIHNQGEVFKFCQMFDSEIAYRQRYIKQNQGNQTLEFAKQLHNMGSVYDDKAQYEKALQFYNKSLKIKLKKLGEKHSSTANTINNIGIVYQSKAEYNIALQYFQRSLKIKIKLLGENNSSTANTLQNIGLVYQSKAQYNKALEYYQRVLNIKSKILGENHSSTANTLQNMGIVYRNKGQYQKALQYYQKSLKIKNIALGQNHSNTANTLQNIGIVYQNKAQFTKALQYYQKALKIKLDTLGQINISTAKTFQNIGIVFQCKADYNKALEYYQKALKIKKIVLGENHNSTANTLQNIGIVNRNKAEYDKALQYYQKALKINTEVLGKDHNITAATLQNIGIAYQCKADYSRALQYYEKSLKIKQNILGENHINTANTLQNIGLVYQSKSEFQKALEYYLKAYNIKINVLGQNHSNMANTIQNIGMVYQSKGLNDKALQNYQKSLKIKLNVLGENHSSTADTLRNIGLLYQIQKKYQIAQSYYMKCYQIRLKIFGSNHEFTKQIKDDVDELKNEKN